MNRPAPTARDIFARDDSLTFAVVEDTYRFTALQGHVELRIDQLHRERGHLIGEMTVLTSLPGARTFGRDGTTLFTTRVNLMFNRDKRELAQTCALRANTRDVPWLDYIEDFVQRVIETEKAGEPLAWVHRATRTTATDRSVTAYGMPLYLDHPQMLFGPAATGKSLLGLAALGVLGQQGVRSLILDWEMNLSIHKERADALGLVPTVAHLRCAQPLSQIADAVKQHCMEQDIQFLLIDSVILACDGPPEDALVANAFYRALGRIGRGALLIAHTRAEDDKTARQPQQQRPFGSVVWHNSARVTWFLKRVNADTDTNITLGIYNPKASFRRYTPPFGLSLDITARPDESLNHVAVRPYCLADDPELAATLPLKLRLKEALTRGPRTTADLAAELEKDEHVIRTTLTRNKDNLFVLLTNTTDGVHRWARMDRTHREQV